MAKNDELAQRLQSDLGTYFDELSLAEGELTLTGKLEQLKPLMLALRDLPAFHFEQLIDLCGLDYLLYGVYDWETDSATSQGFSRGVERQMIRASEQPTPARFAVVYHLLSLKYNQRLRVRCFIPGPHLIVPSVHDVWKGANWFEREAYDLYGILFEGHPDLRRILTDYGFVGHPFRKDFPPSGEVEMRYDATQEKVIYGPVDIVPRILVPKVIRDDNRYLHEAVKHD